MTITNTFYYREGTTEPITITLKDGTSAADITGYASVTIFLRSQDGATQTEAALTVTTADSGIVSLDPGDLTTPLVFSDGAYFGYIIVVDGSADRTSFPSNGEFLFSMLERYSGDG